MEQLQDLFQDCTKITNDVCDIEFCGSKDNLILLVFSFILGTVCWPGGRAVFLLMTSLSSPGNVTFHLSGIFGIRHNKLSRFENISSIVSTWCSYESFDVFFALMIYFDIGWPTIQKFQVSLFGKLDLIRGNALKWKEEHAHSIQKDLQSDWESKLDPSLTIHHLIHCQISRSNSAVSFITFFFILITSCSNSKNNIFLFLLWFQTELIRLF